MSMLAEHRRKTKWVVNPTKKPLWSTESNGIKFGKQLMEKMGWSAGKGLGLNEQGIQEPLRVSFKNDTKGMGFKGNDDDWIEQQDEFNTLLNQLRNCEDSFVKGSGEEKSEIKSLEEKSKTSKARVHYKKFTRGKDLSKYSENDLACILGTNKMKKEKQKNEEKVETNSKSFGNFETSFGVTTINSGSLEDYFKKKWIINKNESGNSKSNPAEVSEEIPSNENYNAICSAEIIPENEGKKSKRKNHKLLSQEPSENNKMSDDFENSENLEKRKRKRKEREDNTCLNDEPKRKKRRKNSNNNDCLEDEASEKESILAEFSREKSKLNFNDITNSFEETETTSTGKELEFQSEKKKNKKEKKIRSDIESIEVCYNKDECGHDDGDMMESYSNIKSGKSKKNKKEKIGMKNSSDSVLSAHRESCGEENIEKFKTSIQEDENLPDTSRKKEKKKDKKEKSNKELISSNLEDAKSYSAVSTEGENEKLERKKKKKKEKLEENDSRNENSFCEGDDILKERVKKKKKKKDKKENSEENPAQGEGSEELVNKKKKKKKKSKEKFEDQNDQSDHLEMSETPELSQNGEAEKTVEGINSSQSGNDSMNDVGSTKTPGEQRIEKLKMNLFGDEASDKYFPQQGANQRVLRMIKWANIAQFKGANLRDVEGYGRRVMYEKQFR